MKIIVEDGFSKIHKTGIGQYTLMIEKLLKELSQEIIVISKPFLSKLKNKILRRILYNIWLNTIFLIKLCLINDNVIVICTNYAIPIWKIPKVKFIPVIHDLCIIKHPECDSLINNWYQLSNIRNAIKNANRIITVSDTIKKEIETSFRAFHKKIFVVNSSLTMGLSDVENLNFSTIEQKYNIKSKNYILSVATLNKRKNIKMLINAYEKIETNNKLVLVGSTSNEQFNCKNKNIIFTGYITDEELKALYKNAKLYVFPSIYEGFGIPLIDAQSFDVPVLCSDIPVFREIGANSVEFFSIDKNNLKEKIMCLLNNEQKINMLVKLGRKNIKRFNLDVILGSIENVISYRE